MSHGHGHHEEGGNKKIAIFISILALLLAIAETAAKGAQTDALSANVEASNLWSFFQAKTIRKTTMETAAEHMEVDLQSSKDEASRKLYEDRIAKWRARAATYESEPKADGKGEGRKELMQRALAAEKKRDHSMAKYHHFEISSAAFQIAIVLASAYVITTMIYLLWISGGLAGIGIIFMGIALFAPNAIHLF